MAKKSLIDDLFGQDIINRGYEEAWEKGTKPLDEINKAWGKAFGSENSYKRTPKYDPTRGSGVDHEGFGVVFNSLFDIFK